MTVGILESATNIPGFKSAVVTSSVVAAYSPVYGQDGSHTTDEWNETAIQYAKVVKDDDPIKGGVVYSASKARAEQEVWNFVKEKKVSLTVGKDLMPAILRCQHRPTPHGLWPNLQSRSGCIHH